MNVVVTCSCRDQRDKNAVDDRREQKGHVMVAEPHVIYDFFRTATLFPLNIVDLWVTLPDEASHTLG